MSNAGEPIVHQRNIPEVSRPSTRAADTQLFSFNRTKEARLSPTSGQSLSTTFEFTGGVLGGNVNYYRPTVDYRYFLPMNKAAKYACGPLPWDPSCRDLRGTSVPFYQRFFMGGDFDIRGFNFRAVSPIAFVVRQIDSIDPGNGKHHESGPSTTLFTSAATHRAF